MLQQCKRPCKVQGIFSIFIKALIELLYEKSSQAAAFYSVFVEPGTYLLPVLQDMIDVEKG